MASQDTNWQVWISSVTPDRHLAVMPEPDPFAALTAALKALAPNPSTFLIAPTFDWNSTEQYDDFQFFIKSVKSWFTLQNNVKEEKTNPDGTTSPNST